MPIFTGLAAYKGKPDGSLESYWSEDAELKINNVTVLVYNNGILKLAKEAHESVKGVKLSPEGENLILQTFAGPIYLKSVKSIQPLE